MDNTKYTISTGSSADIGENDLEKGSNEISLVTLDNITQKRKLLDTQEELLLRKGLGSSDAMTLMKANNFLQEIVQREQGNKKSLLINPYRFDDAEGYKRKRLKINNYTLRVMSKTPIIRAIISTRQAQISSFSAPQSNKYETGYVIRRKRTFYTDEVELTTDSDKKRIKELVDFLTNGGSADNQWHGDTFDSFLKKIVSDSLELDQACFECIQTKGGELTEFLAVDSGTMYLADTFDDDRKDKDFSDRTKVKGYYPSYVQVIEEQIQAEFYPWEMCFGIRNESTDIDMNGYGNSEIEQLVRIITWMLYSDSYNGKFFSQGSSPKGIIKVKPGTNTNRLAEFRQSWQSMVAGVNNAWKIPVMESDSMDWIDLQKNNTDMQFAQWQEYLIKISCAIFKIAPEEVGFNLGNAQGNNSMWGSDTESRIKYSRDKGLKPLLKSIQFWINKYIIGRLDNEMEFVFVGMDVDTEDKEVELLNKKVLHGMGWKEWRKAMELPEELAEGDFPLNAQFIQKMAQDQQADMFGDQMGQNTDEVEQGDFWNNLGIEDMQEEEFVKGHEDNPMMKDAFKMINREKDEH